MYATIQPVSTGWPAKTADKLRVSNVQITTIGLDGKANVQWQLYSDAGSVAEGSCELAGAAYDAWGEDDSYLLTWLAEPAQLGLTIVEIVPDAPPAPPAPPVADEPAPVVVEPAPVDAPAAPVAHSDEAAPAVDGGTDE
jgi:hypothetical protein